MENPTEQMEVHFMTQFFYSRSGAKGIVVLTDNPELLVGQYPEQTKLFVVCSALKIRRYRKRLSSSLPNATFVTVHSLSEKFLGDKLLVCLDYLSKNELAPSARHRSIRKAFGLAMLSMVVVQATEDTESHQRLDTLGLLFPANETVLLGQSRRFFSSKIKDQLIGIGGKLTNVGGVEFPTLKILAVVAVYNERDIVAATIEHLLEQGVDVHIIDNWSTDGSYEIVESLAAASSTITYERFPQKPNNKYEWGKILTRVTEVAKEKGQYRWIMLNDADELRWSPWQGISLQKAFSFIDSLGYNAVDYTVFNFEPTSDGFNENHSPLSFFKYGGFSGVEGHFVQVKSWKNNAEAELAASGGHHVAFSDQKIFPLKFLLGHYPIRSTWQAQEKVFMGRQARYTAEEKKKGWHTHYNAIDKTVSFIRSKRGLIAFNNKNFYGKYLLERISGVGIERDQT